MSHNNHFQRHLSPTYGVPTGNSSHRSGKLKVNRDNLYSAEKPTGLLGLPERAWAPKGTHIRAGKVNIVVVYKVDRLSRSLSDFAKLVDVFEKHGVSFVSVTQQFNTTTSNEEQTGTLPVAIRWQFNQREPVETAPQPIKNPSNADK